MDHAERINRTLAYIEANLDRDIRLDRLACQCALSEYHFHRIFGALVGDVFPHQGPASRIEDTFDRMYRSWFPGSDYSPTLDLDLLLVDARFQGESDDSIVELWMPVAER